MKLGTYLINKRMEGHGTAIKIKKNGRHYYYYRTAGGKENSKQNGRKILRCQPLMSENMKLST